MFTKLNNMMDRVLPEALHFKPVWITLDSGVRVCIDSQLTLEMFAELFITQPYVSALELAPNGKYILDLGANRGLFLLFVAHYFRKHGWATPKFVCVEAVKSNAKRLLQNVAANSLDKNVTLLEGVVCERRAGTVNFYFPPRAHGMGSISETKRLTTRPVPVIDLSKYIDSPIIDVLKIDIEGAEQSVLQSYPDILAKTRVLVGEFHLKEIDYDHCKSLLRHSGLMFSHRTFAFEDKLVVDVFAR